MVLAVCLLAAACYWLGGRRPVRVLPPERNWGARQWRATAFAVGLMLLYLVSSGPMDAFAGQRFWLCTVQLIVVAMLAAPLLVLGAPIPRLARLLGKRRAVSAGPRWMAIAGFLLFNGWLALSYLPAVYAAIAADGLLRQAAQLLTAALAVVFWSQVIAQPPGRCALNHVERAAYLVLSSAFIRVLGLVLGFASTPFYGNTSLFDQQFAAGVLLVPGVLTDLIVLTVCLYLWLGQDDRKARGRFDSGGRTLPIMRDRPLTSVTSRS